jgi:polysaccharide export outer membrane protein
MQMFVYIRNIAASILLLAVLTCFFSSCGNTRQLTLMQGQFDTARLNQINIPEPVIQKGDLIGIVVYSDNPTATALFNQPVIAANNITPVQTSGGNSGGGAGGTGQGGSGSTTGTLVAPSPTTPGYQVDEKGDIEFQGLGHLHIEGLTKAQLRALLDSKLQEFLKNPYYSIRFLNYRFTVLGEVNHPGVYGIPGEHVSILEALGLAGDLTFYGRRDNVLFIRQNNGKREFARLDLTKPEILASPYFNLQQNDVVIVEANRKKVVASDQVTTRNVTIAASIVSTLAILYSIFKK